MELNSVLKEYGRVVNTFIEHFWKNGVVKNGELLKGIVDIPETWLSARLRKVAAREALAMVGSALAVEKSNKQMVSNRIKAVESTLKKLKPTNRKIRRKINKLHLELKSKTMRLVAWKPTMPKHTGKSMSVSCTIAELQEVKKAKGFDAWLHLASIGNKISIDIPIKFHRQYKDLAKTGKRLNSYIITKDDIQFVFEIETGPKKEVKKQIGVDTGITALAALSTGELLGQDINRHIARAKRCSYGSNGHKRASRALKQRMDEVAKQTISDTDLVVVENLKGISANTKLKGRLSQNMRSSIGKWNQSYWMGRLEQNCERNRVSFRSVSPYNTSITCSACGNVDRASRQNQELFECSVCSHTENADVNAAKNILGRFATGLYGACCKPKDEEKAISVCL
ncbi:MAG: zinc ribbon domain-containing protein [Candidatus Cloacimonetes bacterium]|jgi:transposase|nr:zinc ribbon domain-containing protein [Candidatus Cloacimonadota bacterium]